MIIQLEVWINANKVLIPLMRLNIIVTLICISNHMFGIKCPSAISKFLKIAKVTYPKSPNQTCSYWLITPNQQTLCIETNIF